MSVYPPCIKCELTNNSNGLFTCNGCQRSFCPNHIGDHSNELRNRLEEIVNEYNSVKDILRDYKQNSHDLQCKINEIKLEIHEKQKLSNYSEKDLDKWMKQLEQLKIQLTKPNKSNSSMSKRDPLLNFKRSILYLSCILIILILYYIKPTLPSNIRFTDINGPILLFEDGHVAEHIGSDSLAGSFRINQIYTKDIHYVRLTLEKFSSSNTFIGIIHSKDEQSISTSHGWLIDDKQGEYKIHQMLRKIWSFFMINQPRSDIEQGDTIEIEINCNNSKIVLENKRTNIKSELVINQNQSPLPWQIIINLDHHGDRIRLQ